VRDRREDERRPGGEIRQQAAACEPDESADQGGNLLRAGARPVPPQRSHMTLVPARPQRRKKRAVAYVGVNVVTTAHRAGDSIGEARWVR